jgi:hypothetical protein
MEQERIRQLNAKNLEIDVRTRKRNEILIVLGTWAAGLGAILLIAWDMYKTFCPGIRTRK